MESLQSTSPSPPLNNATNKEVFSKLDERMEQAREKNGVKKVVGFYFSVLEH